VPCSASVHHAGPGGHPYHAVAGGSNGGGAVCHAVHAPCPALLAPEYHHHQPQAAGSSRGQPQQGAALREGRRRELDARRRAERRTRFMLLGIVCMIPGLALYFGGGYLFVAAYNGQFPFVEVAVDQALKRIFILIGPIFFFVGLIVFIVSYASFCKGCSCDCWHTAKNRETILIFCSQNEHFFSQIGELLRKKFLILEKRTDFFSPFFPVQTCRDYTHLENHGNFTFWEKICIYIAMSIYLSNYENENIFSHFDNKYSLLEKYRFAFKNWMSHDFFQCSTQCLKKYHFFLKINNLVQTMIITHVLQPCVTFFFIQKNHRGWEYFCKILGFH